MLNQEIKLRAINRLTYRCIALKSDILTDIVSLFADATCKGLWFISGFCLATSEAIAAVVEFIKTQPMIILSLFVSMSHVVAKSLLFLSVGHAKESLQEEDIDNVRGIWSNVGGIPATGILVSGLSFSAFPPTIGFVGEWMVLEALFQSYKFEDNACQSCLNYTGTDAGF